jgi:hypothetical protein
MQSIKEAASIVLAASSTVLIVSGFILSSLAISAFAVGWCRNEFGGNCGNNAPPTNPCSDKPGTISWPSSGGCVPPFCPPGGNKEVRGARLNSGECDPNFNSGSGGNNNNGGGTGSAGGAGSSATGAGTAEAAAIGAIGYVDILAQPGEPGYVPQSSGVSPPGVVPAEPPVNEVPINVGVGAEEAAEATAEEAAAAETAVAGTVLTGVVVAGTVFAVGWWIGCGGEFC